MFHDGDLRSGIALSLSQNKLLTCFINDDGQDASSAWEDVLREHAELIEANTVILKFSLSSQESAYLNTFCPVSQAPAIVIIRYGAVVAKIEGQLGKTDLAARLEVALGAAESTQSTAQPVSNTVSPSDVNRAEPATNPTDSPGPSTTAQSSIHTLLPDRAARLEADQSAKQAADKADRVARAEARGKEAETATAKAKGKQRDDGKELGKQAARADWIKQQAKRKEELVKERERILQSIESDRQERQHRARSKKENIAASEPLPESAKQVAARQAAVKTCNIQVRLPDGSSIRQRFEASQTLADSVRPWIKQAAPADMVLPRYKFKFLKSPQSSKTFDAEEETQTFAELSMLPSATLVLIEQGSAQPASNSLFNRVVMFFYAMLTSIMAFFSSVFVGSSRPPEASAEVSSDEATGRATGMTRGAGGNVSRRTKTLADARARDGDARTEFYNGNSSAFEGRKDDNEN